MKYLFIVGVMVLVGCGEPIIKHPVVYGSEEFVSDKIEEISINESLLNRLNTSASKYPPVYEPTLNMSNLFYNGEEVDWVYTYEKKIDYYSIKIVPCILLKNGTRYCEE